MNKKETCVTQCFIYYRTLMDIELNPLFSCQEWPYRSQSFSFVLISRDGQNLDSIILW
jgi:hypothetical protein